MTTKITSSEWIHSACVPTACTSACTYRLVSLLLLFCFMFVNNRKLFARVQILNTLAFFDYNFQISNNPSFSCVLSYKKYFTHTGCMFTIYVLILCFYVCIRPIVVRQHTAEKESISMSLIFIFPCIMIQYTKMTNKMQLCSIIYYSLAALHVSNEFFAYHQEHQNCITAYGITNVCRCRSAATYVCNTRRCNTVFMLLMMSENIARNM